MSGTTNLPLDIEPHRSIVLGMTATVTTMMATLAIVLAIVAAGMFVIPLVS